VNTKVLPGGPMGKKCTFKINGICSCDREALPGSKHIYCIFHEKKENKNLTTFIKELSSQIQEKNYDFRGYYFPKKCEPYFEYMDFSRHVDFSYATFGGDISFKKTTFRKGADFFNTTFLQSADFEECSFLGDVFFKGAVFRDTANFSYSHFKMRSRFGGSAFYGEVTFSEADFLGEIDMVDTHFFDSVKIESILFPGPANFMGSIFEKDVIFNTVTFGEAAEFWKTRFFGNAQFIDTVFENEWNFEDVLFFNDANFLNIEAKRMGNFKNCVFRGFTQIRPGGNVGLILWGSSFLNKGKIKLDGRISRFVDAEISDIDFSESLWPEDYVIMDEIELFSDHTGENEQLQLFDVEKVYRNLKMSMNRCGNYAEAGEFYYRENECKRKRITGWNRLWMEIYRVICGYGEKPFNVITCSLAIIFGFTGAHVFCGSICFSNDFLLRNLWESFYFSVITFTTLGYGDFHPLNGIGQLLSILEAFIGAFMIAVFVLVFGKKMIR